MDGSTLFNQHVTDGNDPKARRQGATCHIKPNF
jgi:hypothetical protein